MATALHLQILQSLAAVADKLSQKATAILADESVTVAHVAMLMDSLASLKKSFQPLQLIPHDFTSQVHPDAFAYSFDGLIGFDDVAFLVVEGQIVRRSLYSWDGGTGLLSLSGDYRITEDQRAEIYLMA